MIIVNIFALSTANCSVGSLDINRQMNSQEFKHCRDIEQEDAKITSHAVLASVDTLPG